MIRPFLTTSMAAVLLMRAAAQTPAPAPADAPPAVPTHKPEQSALNTLKQDDRNKENLRKALKIIEDAASKNEAAKKEAERLLKDPNIKSADTKTIKEAAGSVKEGGDKKDLDALKNIAEEARRAMGDDGAKALEAVKDRITKPKSPGSAVPGAPSKAATFAGVPGPQPLTPNKKVTLSASSAFTADEMIKPPARDPLNPDKVLPLSDPRTRTYILKGNARVRGKSFAADGDEMEVLMDPEHAQDPGAATAKKTKKPAGVDPVGAGAAAGGAKQDGRFERIIIRGRARIMAVGRDGEVQVGRGGYMIYEKKSGWFILREWPEAQTGDKCFAAKSKDSVIMLSQTEEANLSGCEVLPVERSYSAEDFPRTSAKAVPATNPDRKREIDPTRTIRKPANPTPTPTPTPGAAPARPGR